MHLLTAVADPLRVGSAPRVFIMASSRPLRGRRLASPQDTPTKVPSAIKIESTVNRKSDILHDGWDEPEPRTPVASFEEHKGLERHGVLEHMAPLGHLPGQKLKAKMKYQEQAPRRATQGRNGDVKTIRDEEITDQIAAAPTSRHHDSRTADPTSKTRSSREKVEDSDYEPKITRAAPAKPVPIQPAVNGTQTLQLVVPRSKLGDVVDKATKRSTELGKPDLGLAIKRLYEESAENTEVALLLDAVLTQKQTPEQVVEFQRYVKYARKQIRRERRGTRHSMSAASPVSPRSVKTSASRHPGNLNEISHATEPSYLHHSSTHKSPSKHHHNNMAVNGKLIKEERPSKRMKRASSASSDSPLSSLGSGVEDFVPDRGNASQNETATNHLPLQHNIQTGSRPLAGPRLGSFSSSKQPDSLKRPSSVFALGAGDAPAQELAAKRRKLQQEQSFSDYHISESHMRRISLKQNAERKTPPRSSTPNSRQAPSRLRNGTLQRNKRYNDDDDDDALSTPPSSPGDLLVPPPFGRGVTPTQLGRPPKAARKTARIKVS